MKKKIRFVTRKTPGIVIQDGYYRLEYKDDQGSARALGGEAWMLDVGEECNVLLDFADLREIATGDDVITRTMRTLVMRVEQFENLDSDPTIKHEEPETKAAS